MSRKVIVGIWLFLAGETALCQTIDSDTLKTKQLEEVVITATRNERTVGSLPMPVTLIKQEVFKTMGLLAADGDFKLAPISRKL